MPLNRLQWTQSTSTPTIAGATATAAQMLTGIENLISSSTYWNKTKNATSTKGTIELAPKSTDADIKDGRCLICFSDDTIGAASPNERPSVSNRLAPYATATTTLTPKQWVGFSPNAGTTGPGTDIWTSTSSPYTTWSKLVPLNTLRMSTGRKMGIIQSAQGICIWWQIDSALFMQYIIFGRLSIKDDAVSANWCLFTADTATQTTAPTAGYGWSSANYLATNAVSPPIASGYLQHSAGTPRKAIGLMFDGTTLYGVGRTFSTTTSTTADQDITYKSTNSVRLVPITLSGGTYTGGASDDAIAQLRQIKLGPPAYRGQTITASAITQAICFHYHGSTTTRGGLWFDNYE